MWRGIVVIITLAGMLVACRRGDETPENPLLATVTRRPTNAAVLTQQYFATSTVQGFAPPTINTGQVIVPTANILIGGTLPTGNCNVPAGWRPYIVSTGDTLSFIAFSIGSTVEVIQAGNCLTNADAIFVGQTLYLPNLPAGATAVLTIPPTIFIPTQPISPIRTNTHTATATQNQGVITGNRPIFRQQLVASPTVLRQDGVSITLQPAIALDIGIVSDADQVIYYAGTTAIDPAPVQVGVDNEPFDGTRVAYTFTDFDNELFFSAVAQNEFGQTTSNLLHVIYDADFVAGTGSLQIQPFTGFDGRNFQLTGNSTVTITWNQSPTDAQFVDFYFVGSDGTQFVIGRDPQPSDGARISWLVTLGAQGQIFGRATYSNNNTLDSPRVGVTGN
jgi:LysM repeat protein